MRCRVKIDERKCWILVRSEKARRNIQYDPKFTQTRVANVWNFPKARGYIFVGTRIYFNNICKTVALERDAINAYVDVPRQTIVFYIHVTLPKI